MPPEQKVVSSNLTGRTNLIDLQAAPKKMGATPEWRAASSPNILARAYVEYVRRRIWNVTLPDPARPSSTRTYVGLVVSQPIGVSYRNDNGRDAPLRDPALERKYAEVGNIQEGAAGRRTAYPVFRQVFR